MTNHTIRVLHFAGIINRHDFIDSVLARLDRSRFQVSALTSVPARRDGAYAENEKYPIKVLNFEFNRRSYPKMLKALIGEIKRFQPHILQAHHYDENLIASVALRLTGVPSYVIGHHYSDHIYYLTRGIKRMALLALEGFCNRSASRIVVPSTEVADLLTERQSVPREKVIVLPYGLELHRYRCSSPDAPGRLRSKEGLEDVPVVLSCCRLNQEKGLEYLLRAVKELKEGGTSLRLVMLGNGPEEQRLRQLSTDLGLESVVRFAGWRDDAVDWIATADVVVQPSLCESFCQVLVEALAFRKPVVMTPVGAAPEIIGNNERGRLVPPRDSQAIAAAIHELLQQPELGAKLGALGRSYIEENLSPDQTARQYEELYETVNDEATAAGRCPS